MRRFIFIFIFIFSANILFSNSESISNPEEINKVSEEEPIKDSLEKSISFSGTASYFSPITSADLENFLKINERIKIENPDPLEKGALLKEYGWNNFQYSCVNIRLILAHSVWEQEKLALETLPPELIPTNEELELFKAYKDRLKHNFKLSDDF